MEEAVWNAEEGVWEGNKPPSCEIPKPLYIFGYGSLLWRPGDLMDQFLSFGCLLKGYQRIFAQRSCDHRGTPNFPGFVLTLIENSFFNINNDINELYGKVWLIPDIDEIKTKELIDELDFRERGGYHRHIIDVKLLQSTPYHKEGDIIKAIVYSGSVDNPNFWYISQKDVRNQVADIIAAANGPSGPNASYLINLYKWFKDNNIKDDYLEKLSLDVLRRLGPWRSQLFHPIKYNNNSNFMVTNLLINNNFLIKIKDLFGWGSNEFGQIGIIDNNKIIKNIPERIHFVKNNDIQQENLHDNNNYDENNFIVLSAGAVSACLDMSNQRLYLWGSSWIHSQDLYRDINDKNSNGIIYHRLLNLSPMISVLEGINGAATGHDHILLLLSNGSIIEIRDKSNMKVDSIPIMINDESIKCVKLCAGLRRSAIITSNGRLYSYSDNIDLNFGGDHPSYWQMEDGLTIIDVSCGNKFTVFIDSIGRIWSFGSNKHQALGRSIINPFVSSDKNKLITDIDCIPSLVTSLESNIIWQRVTCGWSHTVARGIKSDGSLVFAAWGRSDMGQYPVNINEASSIDHINLLPQYLPCINNKKCEIIEVWCGSEYTIVADNYGKLWSCGWNEHGNLGIGNYVSMSSWTKVMNGTEFNNNNNNNCTENDVDIVVEQQMKLNEVWEGSLACGGSHVICMK